MTTHDPTDAARDAQRWQAICAAFDEAVEHEGVARETYLAELAASDPTLHAAVVHLLTHDAAADRVVGALEDRTAPPAPPPDVLGLVGQQLAHFRIIAPIAIGGMGVVYRAEHTVLERTVALKLPLQSQYGDAATRARFLREGRAARSLEHPNICRVFEVGESDDGHLYIAMALYEGETLRQRLDRDPLLPVGEAISIAQQIAKGLAAAHAAGVVHRDLKPANVMLEADGGVRLLDFGLARAFDATQSQESSTMGTVAYMAPERVRGIDADARADLWSLGVMLYEMLVGRRPFVGEHPLAVSHAILNYEPSPPRGVRAHVPWRLDALVQQLLRKPVSERPSSAKAVDDELSAIAAGARATLAHRARVTIARAWRGKELLVAMVFALGVVATGAWAVRAKARRVSNDTASAAVQRGTTDAQAWEFFQRAQSYGVRAASADSLQNAVGLYERAIARDSEFARAHARLAIALLNLAGARGARDSSLTALAQAEADRALRLRPTLPEGHLALGYLLSAQRQPDRAIRELGIAAAGLPTSSEPEQMLGLVHQMRGNWSEATRHYLRASEIDPSNVRALTSVATTNGRMREYAEAVKVWDRLAVLEPEQYMHGLRRGLIFTRWRGTADTLAEALRQIPATWNETTTTLMRVLLARYQRKPADGIALLERSALPIIEDPFLYWPRDLMLARLYADLGDTTRARASFAKVIPALEDSAAARPTDYRMRVALGDAYAGAGRPRQALSVARALVTEAATMARYDVASNALAGAAEIYTRAGARTEAIALLDTLLDRNAGREASVPLFRLDPTWDPLRRDPRFTQMLERPRMRRGA